MKLEFADRDNNPESRTSGIILVRADANTFQLWLWVPSRPELSSHPDLHLFNADPPRGNLSTYLAAVDWSLSCDRLVVVKLLPPTFEMHVGQTNALHPKSISSLPPDTSLLKLLQSIPEPTTDLSTLAAIIEVAIALEIPKGLTSLTEQLTNARTPPAPIEGSKLILLKPSPIEKLKAVRRASILTPGTNEHDFLRFYTPLFGPEEAEKLWKISRAAIHSVATGDFEAQIQTSDQLAASPASENLLKGEAAYFKAEGLRLLADIEKSSSQKAQLQGQSMEEYLLAKDYLKDDPRPIRGIGRLLEIRGDLDGALAKFQLAKGLCLTAISQDSLTAHLDIAHELLRSTRHFIHCLLDIRATSSSSVWHRTRKEQELEGYLLECDSLHFEHMPQFEANASWYYIEWFMGLVFIAKAWGALGRFTRMQRDLISALDARRRLLMPQRQLSTIERANLQWWLSVAREGNGHFESILISQIARLSDAVASNDNATVSSIIDDILDAFMPQWSRTRLEPLKETK